MFYVSGFLDSVSRIHLAGEPDVAAHNALCVRPEDGHTAAWR